MAFHVFVFLLVVCLLLWLAQLASFRFVGPAGRFSACRASAKGQYTRRWAARRLFHGHDLWHYLGSRTA